jgi:hypothetical protein
VTGVPAFWWGLPDSEFIGWSQHLVGSSFALALVFLLWGGRVEPFPWAVVELVLDLQRILGAVDRQVVPLGRYWRARPLMFSLEPRYQGDPASAK